jgi:sulfane dehydrogenase subunit SoxC
VAETIPPGTADASAITPQELRLAARNHGMPLEALSYDVTPVGMHYLLIHYDVPRVDAAAWRLEVDGAVERPLSLGLDDLRDRDAVTSTVTFECAGNGRALLEPLLAEAGVADGAVEVLFTALDRGVEGDVEQAYQRSLPLGDSLHEDVLLAWGMNGGPLPPQHGFPLRLVVPGWYGMTNVKWLSRITVLDEPFTGYQNARGYRLRQEAEEEGEPVSRMTVRSLMVPPGIPDFATRRRFAKLEPHVIGGRAWSGEGSVQSVEFSGDGGATWQAAELGPSASPHAWRGWRAEWRPDAPGDYELCCRATDSTGNTQPDAAPWNLGGYANNAVQRVPVTVA